MKLQLIIATLLCLSGITLLFLGFWIPPQGEIDPSVLVAFGETSTFAGALFGVDYRYRRKMENWKLLKLKIENGELKINLARTSSIENWELKIENVCRGAKQFKIENWKLKMTVEA